MKRVMLLLCALLCCAIARADVPVTFDGKTPAVDNLKKRWLLSVPQAVFGADYQASVTLADNVSLCLIDGTSVTDSYTFANVGPGVTYHLWAISGTDTINADIQFTYWPVIQIYGDFVKRPYHEGTVVITHPDSVNQESIKSRVRWAGSSTAEPARKKHNFHLKFYNEDGSKKDMSFFGLRSDFHWRLDAGQVDFARVRNRVAKDIWADFAHEPYWAVDEPKKPYSYVRGDFVEVFLNDTYMGIYSLNEHMDRQQLKLKKYDYETGTFHGGLWKPMTKCYSALFSNLPALTPNQKYWDQIYVHYPNIDDVNPTNFLPFYNAVKFVIRSTNDQFLDSARYYFDIPVFRDYYLFTTLLQAPDNTGKNVYYACYDCQADKRLSIAIWDLDCTQGQCWSNEGTAYHNVIVGPEQNFWRGHLQQHGVMKRMRENDSTFHGLATERYWELRETTFNPDSIVARYAAYFDEMKRCGADLREIARWSRGTDLAGYRLDFDNELEYLREWWTTHIAYLDANVFIPYPKGDVNFDRQVDILDVSMLIDHLLGREAPTFNPYKADVNNNGIVTVADVTNLIAKLLSGEE